jgi:hypothetical protein
VANTNLQGLYNTLKRNPDSQFFQDLVELLNFRLSVIKDQLLRATDDNELKRLQGRGMELQEMISALTRRPVEKSMSTGAFT